MVRKLSKIGMNLGNGESKMETKQIIEKTETLIDALRATCSGPKDRKNKDGKTYLSEW